MRLAIVIIAVVLLGQLGCMTQRAKVDLCETYVRSHENVDDADVSWTLRVSPPPQFQGSAKPALPVEFHSLQLDLQDIALVWFENAEGDDGVCAVHVPDRCAVGFFVYQSNAFDEEPAEYRISRCDF